MRAESFLPKSSRSDQRGLQRSNLSCVSWIAHTWSPLQGALTMLGQHLKLFARLQKACKHEDRAWEDGNLVMMPSPKADSHLRHLSRTLF